jgi:diaminohydroxyphosphoribosylaminopyrimidine deaminase/5-amino-6-(5-phosphoribosylamino)uracil reductase
LLKLVDGDEGRLPELELTGATVYTTLEPCTERSPDKKACALWLIEAKIARVWIGQFDPNPVVYRKGYRMLIDERIEVCDFAADLREDLSAVNRDFIEQWRRGVGLTGNATFDFTQQDGVFMLAADSHADACSVRTQWGRRGAASIYGLAQKGTLALARGARTFEDIDDPASFEFAGHAEPAKVGEILIFGDPSGFALVQVVRVMTGPDRGEPHAELEISWQLRLP